MKVGFGQADVTPTMGEDRSGGFKARGGWPVHDRLWAVGCVIETDEASIAVVGVDTVIVPEEIGKRASERIAKETGIDRDHVLIGASHTHQGGPILTGLFSESDQRYEKQVEDAIFFAVVRAWLAREEGEIGSGSGRAEGIAFNRRFLMRDGKEVTHPGKMHAEIVRFAGPVDEEVGVMAARDGSGKIIGVVVNFACHATVVGGESYSADYIYYLREEMKRRYGEDVAVVFLAGACGDVTQVNNLRDGNDFGHEVGERFGKVLGAGAASAIEKIAWEKEARVAVVNESVGIGMKDRKLEEEKVTLGLGSGEWWEEIYEKERKAVAEWRSREPVVACRVMGVRVGKLVIAANGAELFCRAGLDIKAASRAERTWVVTLANEYRGYVPTASSFFAGGNEARTARTSYLGAEGAQKLVETSLRVLARL